MDLFTPSADMPFTYPRLLSRFLAKEILPTGARQSIICELQSEMIHKSMSTQFQAKDSIVDRLTALTARRLQALTYAMEITLKEAVTAYLQNKPKRTTK